MRLDKTWRLRVWLLLVAILTVAISSSAPFQSLASFPAHLRLPKGQTWELDWKAPIDLYVRPDQGGVVALSGQRVTGGARVVGNSEIGVHPVGLGQTELEFRLFNVIPIRRMTVEVVPDVKVYPGGQSIGVLLRSRGVLVVGQSGVTGPDHRTRFPAREAGIHVGDVVMSVDGRPVSSDEQVAALVDQAGRRGKSLRLELLRGGQRSFVNIRPVFDRDTRRYRIGLFIRDGAAGVGTLTFYDPQTRKYAALGHMITDADTRKPIMVQSGRIVPAAIRSVQKGLRGRPGEKIGLFHQSEPVGTIERNTPFGITGTLNRIEPHPLYDAPVPVAMAHQVEPGPAHIITVIDGQRPERFRVEIERVMPQRRPDGKSMVIRITDPRLLEATGGIVQGMSGSPIMQGGRLVGAVTHVFVNDPTRGYGVFIEWMLQETGLYEESKQVGRSPTLHT